MHRRTILVVDQEWNKTFDIRCDINLKMGEYIIMSNHFYAIVIIGENEYNTARLRLWVAYVVTDDFKPRIMDANFLDCGPYPSEKMECLVLNGKPVFMITSSVPKNHLSEFKIILSIILEIG